MPPTGGETGNRNAEITRQVGNWAKQNAQGVAFDSSSGFILPNTAERAPEASWVRRQLSGDFKNAQRRWRGRLWVEAATGHLCHLEQEDTLEYADTPTPLIVRREWLDFTPSAYGIFVPQRFVAEWNFHAWRAKDGTRQLALRCRFTDEHSGFRQFSASGQEADKQQQIIQ